MSKQKQQWDFGDVFLIETQDKSRVVGQIVGREPEVLNSVSIALFDKRIGSREKEESLKLSKEDIFSILFTTRDLLDSGVWRVVDNRPVILPRESLPYESLRSSGFVGAKVIGSRNVNDFVNAYYGFLPWDSFKNSEYFDQLLVSPSKKPTKLIFKK